MHVLILLTFLKHARGQRAHWYNWVYSAKRLEHDKIDYWTKSLSFTICRAIPRYVGQIELFVAPKGRRSRALVPWCRGASRLGLSFVPLTSFALSFPISPPPPPILQPKSSFGQFWDKEPKAAYFKKSDRKQPILRKLLSCSSSSVRSSVITFPVFGGEIRPEIEIAYWQ